MNSLEIIFGELGISQYLETFVDQGFDSWETILDITESDLDALGVKLGHRRKLQRRIANYRGVAPETSLVSPTRTSIEDAKLDSNRIEPLKPEKPDGAAVAKRKYRRHPKPDDNAPERPPSAYVLFSNKMREDLKGQNLTFTEIAKLVGENWQNLSRDEKDPFERQAHEAKEKYNPVPAVRQGPAVLTAVQLVVLIVNPAASLLLRVNKGWALRRQLLKVVSRQG
ncbi:high mobility group box domain-containing protein [Annulohypoxylon stygium]|nr:high mobility group box domain-containing protein [Annulohypoxylon stygium]